MRMYKPRGNGRGHRISGVVYDAYIMLKDEVSRWRTRLLGPAGFTSASDALKTLKRHPTYVGSGAWYKSHCAPKGRMS
jgi:hypothetical protein